jgi:hypothetical protein
MRVGESVGLQDQQNDLLAKIIAELKGLNLGSGEAGGELPTPDIGRGRAARGQRGRFGARARERLQRIRAARGVIGAVQQPRQIARGAVTGVRPPVVAPETPRPTPPPEAPRTTRPAPQRLRADIRSRIPAAARRAALGAARRIIPGVAIAIAIIPTLNRLRQGDLAGAGIELSAALVGSIPIVGIISGAAAATVNESRDVYRELLGVYPENDENNPEREDIFREIVAQVATYLSEAAEEQAREARERVATREAGPIAGAAAEFYAGAPAPSQMGVQGSDETAEERAVRQSQMGQEQRVAIARQEAAEIQRLWPDITDATGDVTDETLLRRLPRELSGRARRAERELWLRRERYRLYLERMNSQGTGERTETVRPTTEAPTPPAQTESTPQATSTQPIQSTRVPTAAPAASAAPARAASDGGFFSRLRGSIAPRQIAQRASVSPAVQSVGGGSQPISESGSITEIIERGPGFNVVKYDDGRVERRAGSRNWRNNNPGNIEFGDFARRQGAIGTDGRFAIFPTYETGRRAKEALLFEGRNYSGLTIAQAITRYAPPSENDTAMYIRVASSAAGVAPSTPMQNLNQEQRQALLGAMERVEGFRVGSVQVIQQGTAVASAEQAPGPGPTLAAEGAQMAAADQAQTRGQGQEVVVQMPAAASSQQRIAATEQPIPSGRGEVSLNRRLEKQVA